MHDDDAGGDAVCWLHRTCPECGAMPTADSPDRCWRCGWTPSSGEHLTVAKPSSERQDGNGETS